MQKEHHTCSTPNHLPTTPNHLPTTPNHLLTTHLQRRHSTLAPAIAAAFDFVATTKINNTNQPHGRLKRQHYLHMGSDTHEGIVQERPPSYWQQPTHLLLVKQPSNTQKGNASERWDIQVYRDETCLWLNQAWAQIK